MERGLARLVVRTIKSGGGQGDSWGDEFAGKVTGGEKEEEVEKGSSSPEILFLHDRFDRAYLKTAPTIRTLLFVDHIGFPFFNGFSRAFFYTGPASHTFFRNHISHWHHPL
jgi:hypothetical protein